MLKSFTWPDFLLASIMLSLLWWVFIWLLYFRKKGRSSSSLPHSWADEVEDLEETDLMGKPALEHGVSSVEARDFSFGEPVDKDRGLDKVTQLGDLADIQEEIKTISRILAAEDGSKEDFFSLFEMIRNKYPKISSSSSLAALNVFIREHVPFALSEDELENLWL